MNKFAVFVSTLWMTFISFLSMTTLQVVFHPDPLISIFVIVFYRKVFYNCIVTFLKFSWCSWAWDELGLFYELHWLIRKEIYKSQGEINRTLAVNQQWTLSIEASNLYTTFIHCTKGLLLNDMSRTVTV